MATPASDGVWDIPDGAAVAAAGESGVGMAKKSSASGVGGSSGGGQGSSRPAPLTSKVCFSLL